MALSKKYNQFVRHMMRAEKPDTAKLINLNRMILRELKIIPMRERIFLFDKNTGRCDGAYEWITEKQYYTFNLNVPDICYRINGKMHIMEIDGWIHRTSSKVVEDDKVRNERYRLANIPFSIVDEVAILEHLGVIERRAATPEELWPRVRNIIEEQISNLG